MDRGNVTARADTSDDLVLSQSLEVDDSVTMKFELTRKTDLALQALQTLGGSDALHKGVDLAAKLDTSAAFLVQVLAPLTQHGWVRSSPGPRGGYQATDTGRGISLLQLIEAVEGPIRDDRCVLREQPCPATELCALHDAWTPVRDTLIERLAATPALASVADQHEKE